MKIGSASSKHMHQRLNSIFIRMALSRRRGLQIGRGVFFKGKPIIDIREGGQICIGDNVVLNSTNYGYHLNLYGPVKLFADRPGANITIGTQTRIHGSCLHAYASLRVGDKCLIAGNCQIFDNSGHDLSFENIDNRIFTEGTSRPVIIEDCVWVGANSIIMPGVRIGRGSVIGAGSIVTKDIPPMVVAAGNPAEVVKDVV